VSVITGGIAIPGLDYSAIPSTVTFDETGVTVIPIEVYEDPLVEGTESITIMMIYTNLDGEVDTANIALDVLDYQQPFVVVDDVYICDQSANGIAEVSNGFGPFSYAWSSGGNATTENYVEGDAGEYSLTVTDYCGNSVRYHFHSYRAYNLLWLILSSISVSELLRTPWLLAVLHHTTCLFLKIHFHSPEIIN
jgi:hypothetical protein